MKKNGRRSVSVRGEITVGFLLICVVAGTVFLKSVSGGERAEVVIAHFNDLGGRVRADCEGKGGIVRLAGAWREVRSKYPDALLLVAGDLITGSPLSTLTGGEGIFKLADEMDIDAFAPGNHEFDYGPEQYEKYIEIARFPFVAANLSPFGKNPRNMKLADAPYVVVDAGEVKVGIIGAAHPATPWLTFPENTKGVRFESPEKSLGKLVPEVDGKAQLVVALTHIGMDDDRRLAREVKGVDLIIGGHSWHVSERPEKVNDTWISHACENGECLGLLRVSLEPRTERIIRVSGKMIPVGPGTAPDERMKKAADAAENALPLDPDEKIAAARRKINAKGDLAPWLAKIMRKYTGADTATVNAGGVRSGFCAGDITYRDVYRVMPFDNRVVTVSLSGVRLGEWMSGRDLVFDRVFIPDASETYRVATMDFVAMARDIPKKKWEIYPMSVRALMIRELKTVGIVE